MASLSWTSRTKPKPVLRRKAMRAGVQAKLKLRSSTGEGGWLGSGVGVVGEIRFIRAS